MIKVKAVSSETPVCFKQPTLHHIIEDTHLHGSRFPELKFAFGTVARDRIPDTMYVWVPCVFVWFRYRLEMGRFRSTTSIFSSLAINCEICHLFTN